MRAEGSANHHEAGTTEGTDYTDYTDEKGE
jgi:hypothetical protein